MLKGCEKATYSVITTLLGFSGARRGLITGIVVYDATFGLVKVQNAVKLLDGAKSIVRRTVQDT